MPGPNAPTPHVLRAPLLVDGSGSEPVRDAALWLENGHVAYAGPAAGLPAGADQARVLDLPGCTLLPGLVDVHVHLVASGGPDLATDIPSSPAGRTVVAVANARRQLERGVTLVRDLGAPGDEAIVVGRAIEAGEIPGPRVVPAGPAVTMTGGHISYLGRVADGADGVRHSVRANAAIGARCIMVVAEGGVLAALRAMVDSVEHGMFLDEKTIEAMLATGARYTPTFSAPNGILAGAAVPAWIKERARPAAEAQVGSFRAAVEAGVKVVAGTDAGTPDNPHGGVAREVAFMVEAGFDPLLALRAATGEAADLLGVSDRGVLRPGAAADVLAVHGDAVADVSALARPAAVFQDGRRVV